MVISEAGGSFDLLGLGHDLELNYREWQAVLLLARTCCVRYILRVDRTIKARGLGLMTLIFFP